MSQNSNLYKPLEPRTEHPESKGAGRVLSFEIYDADDAPVGNETMLSEAILRRRVVPGRYIRPRLSPLRS